MSTLASQKLVRTAGLGLALASCYSGATGTGGSESSTGATTGTGPTTGTPTITGVDDGPTTMSTSMSSSPTSAVDSTDGTATGTTGTTADTGSSSADGGSSSSSGGDTGPIVPPCPYDAVVAPSGFDLEEVATDLSSPLFAIGHPVEPDRLFVLEQGGTIQMIAPGTTMPTAILTIDDVLSGGERGLLGLAFHPQFPDDPRIYVNYTADNNGNTKIVEYALDPLADWAGDPDSAREIIEIYQPAPNHNGGGIAFDTESWLVIGMGDGGTSSTSRNTGILLSKFLRIGVEPDGLPDDPAACDGCPTYGPFDYTIPPGNPFVGQGGYAEEIFAIGFRNPWRWSIDVGSGQIWIGDVGDGSWEEIDLLEAGHDYGWVDMEGMHCHDDGSCDDAAAHNAVNADGVHMPMHDFDHSPDCAVIGGAVYRSCQVPEWDGTYLYTDYCNSDVRGLTWDGSSVGDLDVLIQPGNGFLGNGWNAWGDVYFTGNSGNGHVWRVVPVP